MADAQNLKRLGLDDDGVVRHVRARPAEVACEPRRVARAFQTGESRRGMGMRERVGWAEPVPHVRTRSGGPHAMDLQHLLIQWRAARPELGDHGPTMSLRQETHGDHGSTTSTPVPVKSLVLRVAQVAPCARQIAAIWASAVWIGSPACSRLTRTAA